MKRILRYLYSAKSKELNDLVYKNEKEFDEQIRGLYKFMISNKTSAVGKRKLGEKTQICDASLSRQELLELIMAEIELVYSMLQMPNIDPKSPISLLLPMLPRLPQDFHTNTEIKELGEVILQKIIIA
jgi:hypothetical protein